MPPAPPENAGKLERCIVIPAVKKNAVIPDQLVKKLAGKTLIRRALDTALGVVPGEHILVVTDSEEIRLICRRAGVGCVYDPAYAVRSVDIVDALRPMLEQPAGTYRNIIIYRASSPLITAADIEDAYTRFCASGSDCLVTVKSLKYRLWREKGHNIDALLLNEEEQTAYVETKALFMLRSEALAAHRTGEALTTTPYFLHDRSVEITSYLDWWVCEKILQSRRIVFVVAGYPAIGMGHIYRALMLAHEITDHRVTFLCTAQSEEAAAGIAARDYRTRVQQNADPADDVLALRPDLVVNDILNTDAAYVRRLKQAGCAVVNFEDEGPGAEHADLVVNALYGGKPGDGARVLCGHKHFCLRDEFLHAAQNTFRPNVKRLLITFGGTDDSDFTRKTLELLFPLCRERGIRIAVVAGPGYAHKAALEQLVRACNAACAGGGQNTHAGNGPRERRQGGRAACTHAGQGDNAVHGQGSGAETHPDHAGHAPVSFTCATNAMSLEMENADLAICSAGRTVYELAHMRIPAIVLSHHEREDMHTFARPRNGFLYLGVMREYRAAAVRKAFERLTEGPYRRTLFERQCRFDFSGNKSRVIERILALLPKRE